MNVFINFSSYDYSIYYSDVLVEAFDVIVAASFVDLIVTSLEEVALGDCFGFYMY